MDADRNLLFGVLALQADIIDAERFAEVCSAWASKKGTPLADLLQQRDWITDEERVHVEFLLERKLRKHGGNPRESLAATADSRIRGLLIAGDDPEVRRSIAELPSNHEGPLTSTIGFQPETRERYTLTRMHAQGGLGRVWLAVDSDLNRQVALKELRPERGSDSRLAARFLEEAKVTGQLEHPGIVPVYELARRSADGQPFYTMRFIRGRTLADAARDYFRKQESGHAGPLDLAVLLNAFVGICNAVAYAHSRGVIHRDLKPQNVALGDFGEVIVLDWGLAKVVGRADQASAFSTVALGGSEDHTATMPGQVMGTPSYMAPEQAEGAAADQLTDVYGLGAILYEILTGRPPFEGSVTAEVLRRVVAEAPARPRSLLARTPRAIEAICLKALAKVPADRYRSAVELADEVRHFLADEPVHAYREPVHARAGRWMRRHRTFVTGAAVLLLTVALATSAGAIVLGRKNREITAERNSARIAAAQTQAVNAFLTDDLLGQADPDANARDKQVSVDELLRRAAAKIDGNAKFAGQPEVEATLRLTLGRTFFQLSNLPEAEKHLRRAVELRRRALGPDDPATLAAQEALANFLTLALNRYTESVPLARQTWQGRSRVLGPEHRDTLDSLDSYSSALARSGRIDEAIAHQRECLTARRRTLGPRHNDTLTSVSNLGYQLSTVGKWSEAIPLLREACDADREGGHETSYAARSNVLALSLYMDGDLEEADRVLHGALTRAVQKIGANSLQADFLRGVQVKVWIDQGQMERAVTLGRQVVAARRKLYPAKNAMTASAQMDLGRALVSVAQLPEAESALSDAVAIFEAGRASFPHYLGWAKCWYGTGLAEQHRYAEAEPHLLAAEAKLRESPTTPVRHYRQCVEQLVKLYDGWNRPAQRNAGAKLLPHPLLLETPPKVKRRTLNRPAASGGRTVCSRPSSFTVRLTHSSRP